jgi:hypothetical protein
VFIALFKMLYQLFWLLLDGIFVRMPYMVRFIFRYCEGMEIHKISAFETLAFNHLRLNYYLSYVHIYAVDHIGRGV